jgi:hypothetical protein
MESVSINLWRKRKRYTDNYQVGARGYRDDDSYGSVDASAMAVDEGALGEMSQRIDLGDALEALRGDVGDEGIVCLRALADGMSASKARKRAGLSSVEAEDVRDLAKGWARGE